MTALFNNSAHCFAPQLTLSFLTVRFDRNVTFGPWARFELWDQAYAQPVFKWVSQSFSLEFVGAACLCSLRPHLNLAAFLTFSLALALVPAR